MTFINIRQMMVPNM